MQLLGHVLTGNILMLHVLPCPSFGLECLDESQLPGGGKQLLGRAEQQQTGLLSTMFCNFAIWSCVSIITIFFKSMIQDLNGGGEDW